MARMLVSACSHSLRDALVAALAKLHALPGDVGQDQPAAVQRADEVLQLLDGDLVRRELGLEGVLDLIQAGVAVQHLQDEELPFLEAEVLQADRVLDHPAHPPLIAMPLGDQVRPHPQRELAGGRGNQAVGKSGHGGTGIRGQGSGDRGQGSGVRPPSRSAVATLASSRLKLPPRCLRRPAFCIGAAGAVLRQSGSQIDRPSLPRNRDAAASAFVYGSCGSPLRHTTR